MLRVRVGYSGIGGTPYLSTFFFDGSGQTAADDAASAVATFQGALDAVQDTTLSWSMDSVVVQIDPESGQALGAYAVTPASGSGALGNESLPYVSQGLIQLRTGVFENGREVRGRLFVPGLTESANNDGTLASATATTIDSAAAALVADADSLWSVWSRTNGVVAQIAQVTVWNQFATLRTRRPSL